MTVRRSGHRPNPSIDVFVFDERIFLDFKVLLKGKEIGLLCSAHRKPP
jgi:hypothetical protein